MGVVQRLRSVDADPDADVPVAKQRAPVAVDQHAIGLKGVLYNDGRGPQALDRLESLTVETGRHDERFAGVPDDRELGRGPARGEQLGEKPGDG